MNLSKLTYPVVLFVLLLGCKKDIQPASVAQEPQIELDSLSKEKIKTELLGLSPESTKDLETFEDFQNLKSLIQTMHTSNPFYIKKYADSINVLIQTIDEDLSQDFKKNTITSRLKVLATASGLLNHAALKKSPDAKKLLVANERLITAYNSLIIQLNELSLAIPDNIEKELLKDQEDLRDSIEEPPGINQKK